MEPSLPPAQLMDDLVEEILLRVPPDDPARLVRAAFVCRRWCRLVSGSVFRRRFCERHRTPPLLGVIHNYIGPKLVRFVPACSFRHSDPCLGVARNSRALDCRHGRVLLRADPVFCRSTPREHFRIWDPVAGKSRLLPPVSPFGATNFNAVVLCAVAGCDHLDCYHGPFLVVFVGVADRGVFASVYSSEADAWSKPTWARYTGYLSTNVRGAHVGNSVYFVRNYYVGNFVHFLRNYTLKYEILKYDLGSQKFTVFDTPPMSDEHIVLMTAEGGGLGCITSSESRLYLWSREAGSDGNIGWVQSRVIELRALIPDSIDMTSLGESQIDVVSFADGSGVIYTGTYCHGSFTYDLKSGRVRKIEGVCGRYQIVPYMSFYTPDLLNGLSKEDLICGIKGLLNPVAQTNQMQRNTSGDIHHPLLVRGIEVSKEDHEEEGERMNL